MPKLGQRPTYILKIHLHDGPNPNSIYKVVKWGENIPKIGDRLEVNIYGQKYLCEIVTRKIPLFDNQKYVGRAPEVWAVACDGEPEYYI